MQSRHLPGCLFCLINNTMKEVLKNAYVEGDIDQTIQNIIDYVYQCDGVHIELGTEYYFQTQKEGHGAHYDWGTNNHMKWCKYSASVLTTHDYEGGEFCFVDDDNNIIETISKKKHYKSALIYDVSHRHLVKPHFNGDRTVLLLFFKIVDD
jgi:hypothetical protein